jgi:regulator of sirC expression with transglutaminase-like and TPR domain
MTRDDALESLIRLGQAPDDGFALYESALACALHENPGRDAGHAEALGRDAVERLTVRLRQMSGEAALAEALAGDLRLTGDLMTYDHPDNADLIALAQRRKGLPVMLGILYLHAARACGLQVQGVDFPGHFLLRIETAEGLMALDPFGDGRVVLPSELSRRAMRAGLEPELASRPDQLMAPVSDRNVLIRLQNNLLARANAAQDWAGAERAALRRAVIAPGQSALWLDVAQAREAQGILGGALEALSRTGALQGEAALAASARRDRLRRTLN